MPRTKVTIPRVTVNDLTEANDTLGGIAALKRDLTFVETCLNEDIDALKAEAETKARPLKAQIKELEAALIAFATYNKGELFKGRRSVELSHGILSFRRSSEVKALPKHTLAIVLGRCKALGFHGAVRIKEELNKDEMRTWPAERLQQVGAKLEEKDVFAYELKQEEITEAA